MKVVILTSIVAATLGAGCREDNPFYDPNLGENVDGSIDSAMACTDDSECTLAATPACDTTAHGCVECTATNVEACETGEVCGDDHACARCTEDAQCSSQVCLADGLCAAADRVIFADPDGDETGACGTTALPCDLDTALDHVTSTQDVVKLAPGVYQATGNTGFEIRNRVTLAAHDATFQRLAAFQNPPPIFTVSTGGELSLVAGRVTSGSGDGIYCGNGSLHLWRTVVDLNKGAGINASLCAIDVQRSHLIDNDAGALLMGGGIKPVTLTNTFITNNGSVTSFNAAVVLQVAADSVVTYNTIADNRSMGNHGISCVGDAASVRIEGNLAYHNDLMGCSPGDNFTLVTDDVNQPKFRSATAPFDYHLTSMTPAPTVRDALDCTAGIDEEGQPRPFADKCDYGADEYMP